MSIMAAKAIAGDTAAAVGEVRVGRARRRIVQGYAVEWTNQMAAYARPEAGLRNGEIWTPAGTRAFPPNPRPLTRLTEDYATSIMFIFSLVSHVS